MTLEEVMQMARRLSALDKLKMIERLAPELETVFRAGASGSESLDDQYQRGYERRPETPGDLAAIGEFVPLDEEKW
ncbi:MAG TPA: hypothetical protein VLJ39_17205 [Tepidisphaeraceae bacterium]|nr:hypothetical protein [Tepidisphaeraceae bacterium]